MTKAYVRGATATILSGLEPFRTYFGDGGDDYVTHPGSILTLWATDELEAIGVFDVAEPAAPDPGQREASRSVSVVAGRPVYSATYEDVPLDALKAAKREAVVTKFAEVMAQGAPYTFGEVAETLQCVTTQDQLNWTLLQTQIDKAVRLGADSATATLSEVGLPPLRCTSNREHDATLDTAAAVLAAIWAYGATATGKMWDLKNRLDGLNGYTAPTDYAGVAAIDETAGWPG